MSYYDDRLSPRRPILSPYQAPATDPHPTTPTGSQHNYQSQHSAPSHYFHPNDFSKPIDSYYSTDVQRAPSPSSYHGNAPSSSPYQPGAHEMTRYQQPPQMQSRPSFSYSDYDDSKSYTSTTHLASPGNEWDIGSVVPPVPQLYPPQPSPLPIPSFSGTSHWHQMRNQLLESRAVQQIPLHNGNLVMDVPVPKGVIPTTTGLGIEHDEMTSMRYSAATCDPDEFMSRKFTLRPYLYGRKTELFVSGSIEDTADL